MSYSEEQLTALKQALSEGTKVVRYQDKWVEYRNFEEMKRIIDLMEAELNKKSRTAKITAKFKSGLY